jgi:cation transport ATPase
MDRGAEAMSGSTNAGDAFELEATREAKDSTDAGIVRLVEEAQAIVAAAKARGLTLPIPEDVAEIPGEGVIGFINGRQVIVGGDGFVAGRVGRVSGDHPELAAGSVMVAVAVDGRMAGLLVMSDPLREGSAQMLQALRRQGIERILLSTGDRAEVARPA